MQVNKLIIGQRGLISTPAVSNLIRSNKVLGGIILTASHNPGGINYDFGIKYNIENGAPAPDSFTNLIYDLSKKITQYKYVLDLECEFSEIGTQTLEVHHYLNSSCFSINSNISFREIEI